MLYYCSSERFLTLQEDVRRVQQIKNGQVQAPDPRLTAFLLYRVERKMLLNTAISMLSNHEQMLLRK